MRVEEANNMSLRDERRLIWLEISSFVTLGAKKRRCNVYFLGRFINNDFRNLSASHPSLSLSSIVNFPFRFIPHRHSLGRLLSFFSSSPRRFARYIERGERKKP